MSVAEVGMPPKPPGTDYPNRDARLMYEVAKDRVSEQLGVIDAIDEKIGTLVTLASALLGLVAAIYALQGKLTTAAIVTLVLGGVVYLIVAGAGMYAYRSRDWSLGPSLFTIWRMHHDEQLTENALMWRVANSFVSCYKANSLACSRKSRALPWIFVAVVAEIVILVIALGLVAES